MSLTHFDETGAARMVDVGDKEISDRRARAEACVTLAPETLQLVLDRRLCKGDVLGTARLAGLMGAKQTANLIPLCHPLGLDGIEIDFEILDSRNIRIVATARVRGRTGVEMEALTAATVAALTIYDMCKSVERGVTIGPIRLLEKSGGRSGEWTCTTPPPVSPTIDSE